jgi:hypothetical protein
LKAHPWQNAKPAIVWLSSTRIRLHPASSTRRSRARFGDRVDRLVPFFHEVDPLADRLVETSEAEGRRLAELIAATTGEPDEDSKNLVRALMESGGAPTAPVTRAERALAERRLHFGYAMCRDLVGDELADKLGIEKTAWRLGPRLLRRVVRATEAVRTSVPAADTRAIAAGRRYWARVVEIGLQGATAEFRMPRTLAA